MDREKAKHILLEVSHTLNFLDIPHFLIQGTALGAYRDKGFTPTEQDIDIGILHSDFKYQTILNEFLLCRYDVEIFTSPLNIPRTIVLWKDCIHVDLVGFIKHKDKRFTANPIRKWTVDDPYAIVHDAELLENYEEIELFGRVFLVPSPIETYLEREYGPDWRTPRVDHVSRAIIKNYLEDNDLYDRRRVLE